MKIAVLGANRRLGAKIVTDAEAQGIGVISLVQDPLNLQGSGPVVLKDYQDLTAADLAGCHYVVDALSFPEIGSFSTDLLPLWKLVELLRGTSCKLLCAGSCCCLYTDEKRSTLVYTNQCLWQDQPRDGDRIRLKVNAYQRLKAVRDVDWALLCPPLIVDDKNYDKGSGSWEFSGDVLPVGLDGSSRITIGDFAKACVELLKRGFAPGSCLSVRAV